MEYTHVQRGNIISQTGEFSNGLRISLSFGGFVKPFFRCSTWAESAHRTEQWDWGNKSFPQMYAWSFVCMNRVYRHTALSVWLGTLPFHSPLFRQRNLMHGSGILEAGALPPTAGFPNSGMPDYLVGHAGLVLSPKDWSNLHIYWQRC